MTRDYKNSYAYRRIRPLTTEPPVPESVWPLRDAAGRVWSDQGKSVTAAFLAAALSACTPGGEAYRAYYDHPQDAEVMAEVVERCLQASQGPKTAHYNDQEEAIRMCWGVAEDAARYCPDGATNCRPGYRRTRADVRQALKAEPK